MMFLSWHTKQGENLTFSNLYVFHTESNLTFRLKEFDDILQQDVIDLRELRKVSFNGRYPDMF